MALDIIVYFSAATVIFAVIATIVGWVRFAKKNN